MITVAEAKSFVQAHIPPSRVERIPLATAHGYTLAEDVAASEASPRFTNSAMDGVAVRFTENTDTFRLIGESAAGQPFTANVHTGEAVNISTGAALPEGADTVVPVEDCLIEGTSVRIPKPFVRGQWVRQKASEYSEGAQILTVGTVLRPAHIALAAQNGCSELLVFAPPRVGLIATGTEIIASAQNTDKTLRAGQIFDANTPMLQAAIADVGGKCVMTHHVADSLQASIDALSKAAEECDIICTTGGISVGEHDHIKEAVQKLGFETIFWRVRQKPGKPLFFAKRDKTLLFGLPGNPVSTLMCFVHYVRPVIASMLGRTWQWQTAQARMSKSLVNTGGRAEFLRVRLNYLPESVLPIAVPLEKQESFMLTSLTEADGFVFLDIDAELSEGAPIEVLLF